MVKRKWKVGGMRHRRREDRGEICHCTEKSFIRPILSRGATLFVGVAQLQRHPV